MEFNQEMKESLINLEIQRIPKITKKLLKNKKKILDLGIGTGWLTKYIDKETEYHGITYRQAEKERLKELGYNNIKILDLEEENLPYKNETFDLIYAGDILEHFEKKDLQRIIQEVYRVLKKNGVFIAITPSDYNSFFYGEWSHVRPYNHDSLPALLRQFNFKNVDWCYPDWFPNAPKWFMRYGRFPLFFLKNFAWRRIMSYGYKK